MSKWKVILVDDEPKSTDILKFHIDNTCPMLEIVGLFNNPELAIAFIQNNSFDLLFLDIQMPKIDGFQLLDALTEIDFKVVFITAYDDYALKAFKYYAIDYILKPVVIDELVGLCDRLSKDEPSYSKNDFTKILEQFAQPERAFNHLAVPTNEGVVFLLFEDILRLQADSNYCFIFKRDGQKLYASKTLKYFEALLPQDVFFRPHQSHIINISFMDRFVRIDGGHILMKDGKEIILARSKRQEFLNRFLH